MIGGGTLQYMSDLEESDLGDAEADTTSETADGVTADTAVPLESDPADWQEQQLDVPDPDLDERR